MLFKSFLTALPVFAGVGDGGVARVERGLGERHFCQTREYYSQIMLIDRPSPVFALAVLFCEMIRPPSMCYMSKSCKIRIEGITSRLSSSFFDIGRPYLTHR